MNDEPTRNEETTLEEVIARRERTLAAEISTLLNLDTDLRESGIDAHADGNRVHVINGGRQYFVTVDSVLQAGTLTDEEVAEEADMDRASWNRMMAEEADEEIQRDRDEQGKRDRLKDERIDAESERAAIRATVAEAADNLIEAADDGRLEALVAEAEAAGHDDRADYYRALIVMAHAAT